MNWVIVMIDEVTKKRYLVLEQDMIKLNQQLDELSNMNKKIIKKMKETIKIDNKIIKEEVLALIPNSYSKSKNIVLSNIIPSIHNKVN